MRDIFVGALISVGAFLYLYKGFSKKENWALNLAGLFAIGVALFPTTAPGAESTLTSKIHGTSAVALFLCIAYVAIFRAKDTLSLIGDPQKVRQFRRTYRTLGTGMIISPLIAVVLMFTVDPHGRARLLVFFVEAVAVWMFAAYWLVKSRELKKTGAQQLALAGKVKAVPEERDKEATGRLIYADAAPGART